MHVLTNDIEAQWTYMWSVYAEEHSNGKRKRFDATTLVFRQKHHGLRVLRHLNRIVMNRHGL
jgi:hypothetical protein